jgi:hypothetical protein
MRVRDIPTPKWRSADQDAIAYELTLAEGLRFERRIFHGLFATNDQKEGKILTLTHAHTLP